MKKTLISFMLSIFLIFPAIADNEKIGIILGFTGPIESLAPVMAKSAEMAIDEVNKSGNFTHGKIDSVRGDSTCVDAAAAQAAAGVGAQELMALAATAMPASFNYVVLDLGLNVIDPLTELPDSPVVKQTVWTQTELGYKGQVSDNMTLTVDAYQLNVEGYVTSLQGTSGIVTQVGNASSYVAAIMTAMAAGGAELTAIISGWDNPAAGGKVMVPVQMNMLH